MQLPSKVLLLAVAGVLTFAGLVGATANAAGGNGAKYIVLYKGTSVPQDAATTISRAGGTLVYGYDQIGVAIAQSDGASFRGNLLKDNRIEDVTATARLATRLPDEQADGDGPPAGDLPNAPTDADTFSPFQWDMQQIKSPEAHQITGGSPSVLVGDIDTGLDYRHPDLRQNVDSANSVNCVSGAPVPGAAAADDDNGHGTHTAGTIAAASNGVGVVGVAPNVHIAGIKAGNSDGFFFPEAVVCSFYWAATHGFNVTNNSYFADPWYFNCKNDPAQRSIWKAESRAIEFAAQQGVTNVAAMGNFRDDLAHPTRDVISPDDGTPVPRTVHNDCAVVPVEVPGVIGVTATGVLRLKSFYSNYGVGVAEVAAPGGDSVLQSNATTDPVGRGRVLSTYPASQPCTRPRTEPTGDPSYPTAVYCYLQGTSMASPHVAGLAALVISRFGGRPGQVAAMIEQTADPQDCPTPEQLALYQPFPSVANGEPQSCQGAGSNSWFGKGIVNALTAVTHGP